MKEGERGPASFAGALSSAKTPSFAEASEGAPEGASEGWGARQLSAEGPRQEAPWAAWVWAAGAGALIASGAGAVKEGERGPASFAGGASPGAQQEGEGAVEEGASGRVMGGLLGVSLLGAALLR
ncbi:MAG: hypothetical protein HYZ11_03285 [Candidatus Tectomicrobia bacterium]|uniref:Uncharacterized protein n=1 Tax=Tectimicrobiota bacterium TaxID=2528274 RepID=A0A932HX30_UNCTE|nr:hypothetical protein [Candidatus Tectomicrobia bacterium]